MLQFFIFVALNRNGVSDISYRSKTISLGFKNPIFAGKRFLNWSLASMGLQKFFFSKHKNVIRYYEFFFHNFNIGKFELGLQSDSAEIIKKERKL